jgi:hypothetical protein
MRERRRAWTAVVLVVALTGVVPLALDRDSLPLSTFPMFSADIDSTQSIATAIGVAADGSTVRLEPEDIAATTVVNQAVTVVADAIASGRADRLCADIAGRLRAGGPSEAVAVAVEVVTESYDAPGWFDGNRQPVARQVHARCDVAP